MKSVRIFFECGICLLCMILPTTQAHGEDWPGQILRNLPASTPPAKRPHKILCLSSTWGYRHSSIPTGNAMIQILGQKTGLFSVDFSTHVQDFSAEHLKPYDALVFNNTTHLDIGITDASLRNSIIQFVKNGGGLVCMHAASSSGWEEYTTMIGGAFDGHPWTASGNWFVANEDPQHPIVKNIYNGRGFRINDELYQFKNFDRSAVRVLLAIDLQPPVNRIKNRKRSDDDYALVWIKPFGRGRIFQCALGHHDHFYANPEFLKMWIQAFRYVLGELDVPEQSLAKPRLTGSGRVAQ